MTLTPLRTIAVSVPALAAAQRAGLFYGAMSLWQLATPHDAKGAVALPAVAIEDAPRFAWRGLMVDSARQRIPLRAPATPGGELEVRAGCAGERIAAIPLGDAAKNPGLSTITGRLPARPAKVDLCLSFTAKSVDPFWAIERVTLTPANY